MSTGGLEPPQISPHAPQACASTIPPRRQNNVIQFSMLPSWRNGRYELRTPRLRACRHVDKIMLFNFQCCLGGEMVDMNYALHVFALAATSTLINLQIF